jgi:eukaryotic-like serine/threonine-protein kinase
MTDAAAVSSAPALPAFPPVLRQFGDYGLLRPLGRSSLTIAWLALDTRTGEPVRLLAASHPVPSQAVRERCAEDAQRAARLQHPRLAPVRQVGVIDRFPYVVCGVAPADLQPASSEAVVLSLDDLVRRSHELLDGLSYVHEAAMLHGDLGLHTVLFDGGGRLQLWGCGLAVALAQAQARTATPAASAPSGPAFQMAREIAASGLLVQHWLLGRAPLGEPDMPTLLGRLHTADLRLPADLQQPVPLSLRLILDRSTDLHPQHRFVHARSFERVLGHWRDSQLLGGEGFDALLAERIRRSGHLPALPMLNHRVMQIARMEQQRLDTVVDVLLEDIGLSLGLLRAANAADTSAAAAEEPVITVQRAMQLMGTLGLRRVATGLKTWPGTLRPPAARTLAHVLQRALLAGHVAEALAPPGMDAESVQLAAQLQHLGSLLAHYHFSEEMQQICRLTTAPDGADGPPVSSQTAMLAVLGVDMEGLTASFLRLWGLTEALLYRVRAIPAEVVIRTPTSAPGWVKLVASCANEVVVFSEQSEAGQPGGLAQLLDRYHQTLGLDAAQVHAALHQARDKLARHLTNLQSIAAR